MVAVRPKTGSGERLRRFHCAPQAGTVWTPVGRNCSAVRLLRSVARVVARPPPGNYGDHGSTAEGLAVIRDPRQRSLPLLEVGLMAATNNSRVLLVRHGRTALNAENRLRGRLNPELDEVGQAEARALAEELAALDPARVVSSPLLRAVQTAEAIARLVGVRVVVEHGLIDRDYGQWAGNTRDELIGTWGSVDGAPGVEPAKRVLYRASVALVQQFDFLGARPVVLVSHDAVNRALLAHLDPSLGPASGIGQRTACWNELIHVMGDWRVTRVDQKPPVHAVGAR